MDTLRFLLAPFAGGALVAALVSGRGGPGGRCSLCSSSSRSSLLVRAAAARAVAQRCPVAPDRHEALVGREVLVPRAHRQGRGRRCVRLGGEIGRRALSSRARSSSPASVCPLSRSGALRRSLSE